MTYIYNPQQLEAAENTFITALAFASSTGILTATRNDGVELSTVSLDGRYVQENTRTTSATFNTSDGVLTLNQTDPVGTVTVDLDGRFPTENTHLDSATLGADNVLSLGMVNPTSTITVDLSDLSDLNTHLDSATFNAVTKVLSLNMINPESTITVNLSGIEGENTFVTSATFVDGNLNLNRNDGATVSVDLDGRYSQINTHLNAASFDAGTRDLTLTTTDPEVDYVVNIPISPDENTFLTSLAFNTNSGELIATLNNDDTVTVDLDGRFNLISNNTHVNSGSYNADSAVLTLNLVNPASTVSIPLDTAADQNTHLDSASLTEQTLNLNMVNPESTITVDLGDLVNGKYLPISFETAYTGNLNDLLDPGVYSVSSTALNVPPEIEGNEHFVQVYSDKTGDDSPTSCVQIWTTGMNQSNGINPNTRMWMRIFSIDTIPIVSSWQEINNGGLNGYLKGVMIQTGRDFNAARYRQSGYYFVDNVNSPTQGWTNGPDNFPDSQFNVLKTVMTGYNALNLSYGHGYQELSTATYDASTSHVRTWKRSFEASSSVENYTDWYEVFHQGIPINTEVLSIYKVPDSRSTIDVKGVRVIDLHLGLSYAINSLINGVEGQVVTFIKTNYNGMVTISYQGNIQPPSGGFTSVNLRYHRGASFILTGGTWYPLFSNSTS